MTARDWLRIGLAWSLLFLGVGLNWWASATMYSIALGEGEAPPFGYLFRIYWVPVLTGCCGLAILLFGIAAFRHCPKWTRGLVAIPMLIACWFIVDSIRWGLQRVL
jgi:hypothetical protein